jgi:hypothetical protein
LQVPHVVHVQQWLSRTVDLFLVRVRLEKELLVVDVAVLVVFLVCREGDENGVETLEDFGLELQVTLQELLPKGFLGELDGDD